MAVLDSTTLLHLLEPDAKARIDTRTGRPFADAKDRVEALLELLHEKQEVVLVPTPVISEVLVHAGGAGPSYPKTLGDTSRFRVAPFDQRAAVELAEMTRQAIAQGDLRAGTDATRAQLRFDRQILAIARVQGETDIYTDDGNMRKFAENEGFRVTGLPDIPLPRSSRQASLPISDDDTGHLTLGD